MSEPLVSGNTPDERLHDALIGFTGCIGEALEDICSYSLTIGETYVPFDPDPDDDESEACGEDGGCNQAWVRVMGIVPIEFSEQSFSNGGCGSTLRLSLEVGVLRCIEVPEGGEAPTASDVLIAAMQSMTDMRAIYCAAMTCGDEDDYSTGFDAINPGTWTPSGPLGGQYGGIWTFDVDFI